MTDNGNRKRTWLIVEDEMSLRGMLAAMVLYWGIEPLTFEDGHRAMAWLDKVATGEEVARLPELALLDIRLPGPQGYEVAARLRSIPATADAAIVMMTAYHCDPAERALIEELARPDLFLRKPLPRPDELKTMLEQALSATRGPGEGEAPDAPRHTRRYPFV